ncbi:uncharacterized protein LOC113557101 [Rhopalosiphum maidis]|uniref:uncharacterized protein LOC113557101 n=1 Tax=Rhopalosiphum maidis TaxID=43146 RepID=UPI000EFDD88F|nr:uncharacterized protein LOC113557101 [Rhopalosiphum maidis]
MSSTDVVVPINYLDLCRICLAENHLTDILMFGETSIQWIKDIKTYFNVQLQFNDHKSTKLCRRCIHKIESWRRDMRYAVNSQIIIDFFDRRVQSVMGIDVEED